MGQKIDEILQQRQAKEAQASASVSDETEASSKFYSVMIGEGMQENFLELRFSNGLCTCFSNTDLMWFNHDPESSCLDLAFGGFLITIKGRGLLPLFRAIKQKRVAWVQEADSDMEDHPDNECFIEEIGVTPPKDFIDE
jgi:hypothetical protein